jgi:hypothetical protein
MHFKVVRMFIFARKCGLATVLALSCLSGWAAHAQVAPVRYWIPGGLFGFGGDLGAGRSADAYGNFPSFDAGDVRGGEFGRTNLPSGWFVSGERGTPGLSGLSQPGVFGNFGSPSFEGVQFGYNFKGAGGLPVTFYAGFDTLKYNSGAAGALAPFNSSSMTVPGYGAHAGFDFQPAPNVSLSFGVGYTQMQTGRIDSDINSPLLPGETPMFSGGRR